MPNIASAKKRARQALKRNAQNTDRRSSIKTAVKKVVVALENNDVDAAKTLLRDAESKIARAKGKGLFHAKTASRKVSRLAKRVASAGRS